MGRRTFSDRGSQLSLPLATPATQVPVVTGPPRTLVIEPSSHHVEHALRRGASAVTTLPLLESRLARALIPGVRVADNALARVTLRRVLESLPSLAASAERAGLPVADFLDALDGALGALHAADVDATHLVSAARGATPGVRSRLSLLAEAMSAHEQALAALGLSDRRTIASRVARALAGALPAALDDALGGARVVELRDFASLPPARLALIEGRLEESGAVLVCDDLRIDLSEVLKDHPDRRREGALTLGIRPEDLRPTPDGNLSIRGEVDIVEDLGSDRIIHLKCGNKELVVRLPGHASVRQGEILNLTADAGRLHLFSGKERLDLRARRP